MSEIKVINLTPHALNVVSDDGQTIVIEPSGFVARVATKKELAREVVVSGAAIPVHRTEFGAVQIVDASGNIVDLPPEDGTIFVVSRMVLDAAGRGDFVSPGDPVRDDSGRVIGCRGFAI